MIVSVLVPLSGTAGALCVNVKVFGGSVCVMVVEPVCPSIASVAVMVQIGAVVPAT